MRFWLQQVMYREGRHCKKGAVVIKIIQTFSHTFFNENHYFSIKVSQKHVRKDPIDNNLVLVSTMDWRRTGDKPLPEPMIAWFGNAYPGLNELVIWIGGHPDKLVMLTYCAIIWCQTACSALHKFSKRSITFQMTGHHPDQWWLSVNSLAPGRPGCHFKTAIFNLVLLIGIFTSSKDNALRWMPRDLSDDKSTLVQVTAWCQQAITWANVDLVPCRHMVSLGHNELMWLQLLYSNHVWDPNFFCLTAAIKIHVCHMSATANIHYVQWPLLLTWFNFNPSMDK